MIELYNSDRNGMARIKPDKISFNTAISSLSKDQLMEVTPGAGGSNNSSSSLSTVGKVCYEHLMTMLSYYNSGDVRCAPDLISFSTVLHVLGRGKNEGDEERAKELLDIMLYLSGVVSDPTSQPDYEFDVLPRNRHFNIVLSLMAGSKRQRREGMEDEDALNVARRYVGIMEMLRKNDERIATAATTEQQGHDSSQYLLPRYGNADNYAMEERYDDKTIISMTTSAPDIVTYNTLLSVAARAGRPEVAEEILEDMIEKSSSGKSQVKPDDISFNTVRLIVSLRDLYIIYHVIL